MLEAAQLEHLEEHGYVVVPDVLDATHLDPVAEEYERALDAAARRMFDRGELTTTQSDLPFAERYTALMLENPDLYYYLGLSLPLDYEGLDPEHVRCHTGPALFSLLRSDAVLDIVESVIGSEIALNPIMQARLKPPQALLAGPTAGYSNVGATTWHQDFGAAMDEAADTEILTVWIAMTDATEEMGCLVVMPGSHASSELTLHCPGKDNQAENYIPTALLERYQRAPLALSCRRGSVVLLTRFTEHAALENRSARLRWSFDLRYQRIGEPSGRPAFPTLSLRSKQAPESEVRDPEHYAAAWRTTRDRLISGAQEGPVYEQGRWLKNLDHPVCA